MTVRVFPLGKPRPAASRGGDCRAHDLRIGRKVQGPHRFYAPEDCQLRNGMLRVRVSAAGSVPTLTWEAYQGRRTVDDFYVDTYSDTYSGSTSTPVWVPVGALVIDSPSVSAVLTRVEMVDRDDEAVTVRLVVPAIGDVFVTLERGERLVHIQHGDLRQPVDIDRRIRLTDSPSPVGSAFSTRVEESTSVVSGFLRWVGSLDAATADAGAFSVTASSVTTARFGAGVATSELFDTPSSQHSQLGDSSVPVLEVEEVE